MRDENQLHAAVVELVAMESAEIKELRLRPGEGFTVQQITSSTVGSFAWLMAFTVDDDL